MSEYQYYEFLAIDHPLSRKQIYQVREFSTRAEITSTRFVNEYHWGNFKGNPDLLVTKYFDLMLYYANWGTHRLLLGLPADAVKLRAMQVYASSDVIDFRKSGDRILIDFVSQSEDYDDDFTEGGGQMASLAPIRSEILCGDLRPLYVGWLAGIFDEDSADRSPPIPPGLDDLTPAQIALANYLRVDDDLLEAACRRSQPAAPPKLPLKDWIGQLPQEEKNQLLFDAASGEGMRVGTKLMQRYAQSQAPEAANSEDGLPLEELLEYAQQIREKREAEEREAAERKRARQAAKDAAAREKHLDELAARQQQAWSQVDQLLSMKQSKAYDSAIANLRDLRDVAIRQNALAAFAKRVDVLREAHAGKSSFIKRLESAGLLK